MPHHNKGVVDDAKKQPDTKEPEKSPAGDSTPQPASSPAAPASAEAVVADPKAPAATSTESRFLARVKDDLLVVLNFIKSAFKLLRAQGVKKGMGEVKASVPKNLKDLAKEEAKGLVVEGKAGFRYLRAGGWKKLLVFIGFLVSLALALYFLKLIATGEGIHFPKTPDYLNSFETVATRIEHYDENEPMEEFDSPLRHPEHVVLLRKMVVNLSPSQTSTDKPMAIFELFIEASSRDVAIEIKDREKEMVDIVSRVAESTKFDDFSVAAGKERFKLIAKREINRVLNTGRVHKVYFKTVFHKR